MLLMVENDLSNRLAIERGVQDDVEKRLYDREKNRTQYFAEQSNKQNGLRKSNTRAKIIEERRQNLIQNNMNKFANFAKGVHGLEIPKFSDGDNPR